MATRTPTPKKSVSPSMMPIPPSTPPTGTSTRATFVSPKIPVKSPSPPPAAPNDPDIAHPRGRRGIRPPRSRLPSIFETVNAATHNYPIHIAESLITEDDLKDWRVAGEDVYGQEVGIHTQEFPAVFSRELQHNKVSRSTVVTQVKPHEIYHFVKNKNFRDEVIKNVVDDMRKDKSLYDSFKSFMKIRGFNIGQIDAYTDPQKALILADIVSAYQRNHKLPRIGYHLSDDSDDKHVIDPNMMKVIEQKQILYTADAGKLSKRWLEQMDEIKSPVDASTREVLERIEEASVANDMKLEQGLIDMKAWMENNENLRNELDEEIGKGNAINTNHLLQEDLYITANIMNKHLRNLSQMIKNHPNNNVSKHLDKILTRLKDDLQNGRINLESFYGQLNTLGHMIRPQLEPQLMKSKHPRAHLEAVFTEGEYKKPVVQKFVNIKNREIKDAYINRAKKEGYIQFPIGTGVASGKFYWADKANNLGFIDDVTFKGMFNDVRDVLDMKSETGEPFLTATGGITGASDKTIQIWKKYLEDKILDPASTLKIKSGYFQTFRPTFNLYDNKGNAIPGRRAQFESDLRKLRNQLLSLQQWGDDILNRGVRLPSAKMTKAQKLKYMNLTPDIETEDFKTENIRGMHLIEKPVELAQSTFIDDAATPEQSEQKRKDREKKYSQENFIYARKISREEPETLKAYYGPNTIEYMIKTEADLSRMRYETKKGGGQLYIVDLRTGRLFPIQPEMAFVGNTYIYMKNQHAHVGGSFAFHPVLRSIQRDEESLFPYIHMRNGNDKIMSLIHRLPNKAQGVDYRDQLNELKGGSFWKHIKNGIKNVAFTAATIIPGVNVAYAIPQTRKILDRAGNAYMNSVESAGKILGKQTLAEAQNYYNQSKNHLSGIYNVNKSFINNPNIKTFGNAVTGTYMGGLKMWYQPILTTAREAANVSDFVGNTPGGGVIKTGAKFAFAPLAVADGLAHAARASGLGSDQKANYLDTAIGLGDAILGTKYLTGAADAGARVLTYGAKVADIFDKEHK